MVFHCQTTFIQKVLCTLPEYKPTDVQKSMWPNGKFRGAYAGEQIFVKKNSHITVWGPSSFERRPSVFVLHLIGWFSEMAEFSFTKTVKFATHGGVYMRKRELQVRDERAFISWSEKENHKFATRHASTTVCSLPFSLFLSLLSLFFASPHVALLLILFCTLLTTEAQCSWFPADSASLPPSVRSLAARKGGKYFT